MIRLVSRQLGAEVVHVGSTVYLGEVTRNDRALLVTRVPRIYDEAEAAISSQLSDVGDVFVLGSGIVIVSDVVAGLNRVQTLIDQLHESRSVTWAVQLYILRDSWQRLKDVGVDFVPALELGYTFASASQGLSFRGDLANQIDLGFNALLKASDDESDSRGVFSPFLLVADGQEATLKDGRRRLVPTGVQSVETGNAVQTGYQEIQVGLNLKLSVADVDRYSGRLNLDLEISDSDALVGNDLVISDQSMTTTTEVRSGGVYLLGSLTQAQDVASFSQLLSVGSGNQGTRSTLDIWAKVHRISSDWEGVTHATPEQVLDHQINQRSDLSEAVLGDSVGAVVPEVGSGSSGGDQQVPGTAGRSAGVDRLGGFGRTDETSQDGGSSVSSSDRGQGAGLPQVRRTEEKASDTGARKRPYIPAGERVENGESVRPGIRRFTEGWVDGC